MTLYFSENKVKVTFQLQSESKSCSFNHRNVIENGKYIDHLILIISN